MRALPALGEYIARLRGLNASVVNRLRPGASKPDIQRLSALEKVELPDQARDYWATVNGVEHGEPWDQAFLVPLIYAPRSISEAIDHDRITADLRSGGILGAEEDENYWPSGLIVFAGEDGNGVHVNCRPGSTTYGAIYERAVSEFPLARIANSMNAYFATLVACIDEGVIKVATRDANGQSAGSLVTDHDGCRDIGRRMNPDCPGFNPELIGIADPDW